MKHIFKQFFLLVFLLSLGCDSADDKQATSTIVPIGTQYPIDIEKIELYLSNHYIKSVNDSFDVTLEKITENSGNISIKSQTQYPLLSKIVTIENVPHKIYYLVLREGTGTGPTGQSVIKCAYKGFTLDDKIFDSNSQKVTSLLSNFIQGWQEILPLFKSGNYTENADGSINTSSDFGAGVMFLPSALAYYYQSPAASVPEYSPLIFSFKLRNVL